MNESKTVYIDLDGVICDFEGTYQKLFGVHPKDAKDSRSENWKSFVEQKAFENLDMISGADTFLNALKLLQETDNVTFKYLTSAGGKSETNDSVKAQKNEWLRKKGLDFFECIVVYSGSHKADYANAQSMLVDDTQRVLDKFKQNGGNIFRHTNSYRDTLVNILGFIVNSEVFNES